MKKIDWVKVIRYIFLVSACSILIVFLTSMVGSLLVTKELLSYEYAGWLQMIIMMAAALVACMLSAQKAGHGKMVVSIITVLVLMGCFLVVKILLYPECGFGAGKNALLMFAAAVLGGFISGRKRTRR